MQGNYPYQGNCCCSLEECRRNGCQANRWRSDQLGGVGIGIGAVLPRGCICPPGANKDCIADALRAAHTCGKAEGMREAAMIVENDLVYGTGDCDVGFTILNIRAAARQLQPKP